MKKIKTSHFFMLGIVFLTFFLFFKNLFLPHLSIYATPDFGRSEVWSLNYPLKELLSRSLKTGHLPFWNTNLGGGYPVFAEGIIGSLYLPNLVLFGLFPTPLAWNLSYLLIFFLIFIGCFVFFEKNIKNLFASLLAAIVFTFCGYNVVHIPHYPLIQAVSLFPWILYSGQILLEKRTKWRLLFLSFLVSQQIFAGHPEVTFMTILALVVLFVALNRDTKTPEFFKKAKILVWGLVFALLFSAPQLLPSLELYPKTVFSIRGLNILREIYRFPYHAKYLLTTIFPNFFGSPSNGTFPDLSARKGIYWEINSFIGIVPALLALLSVFKRKKEPRYFFAISLLVISVFLCLSGFVPLNLIYLLPGFNLFRVTSRFLLLSDFALAFLSGLGLKILIDILSKKSKLLTVFVAGGVILVSVVSLLKFGVNYNPTVPFSDFLEKPEISSDVPSGDRVFTDFSVYSEWEEFKKKFAWSDPGSFLFFLNSLSSNHNLIYDKTNISSEISAPLRRQLFLDRYPDYYLLGSSSVDYFISARKLPDASPLVLVNTYSSENKYLPQFYLYRNKDALPRFRVVSNYEVKPFDFYKPDWDFNEKTLNFGNAVLLEKDPGLNLSATGIHEVNLISESEQFLKLSTKTDNDSIFVVADTNYPGWFAWVNGKRTKILNANINQRAITLPAGENVIVMRFVPVSFYIGLVILSFSLFAYIRLIHLNSA